MTACQPDRTGSPWAWLIAVPVLCCAGHAVLLAVGAGSLTAVISGTTDRAALVAVGFGAVLAAVAVVLGRRRRSTP